MAWFLVKHGAQGFDNGFGVFLGCEERDGWLAAMDEAMKREYAAEVAKERAPDGKAIQYQVLPVAIANQAEFDAFRRAEMLKPVVNVYD